MRLLILLLLIALAIYLTYLYIRYKLKHKIETITAYTGGLGSGKTLLSVVMAKKLLRKQNFKYRTLAQIKYNIYRGLVFWKKLPKKEYPKVYLFSNIPILLNKKQQRYSLVLTKEHLLLQERLPLHSVILLDEVGSFASQFDFNQNNVIKVFDEFVRFYRHYTQGGYLIVNDQCSENINLTIRRRINIVHNLSNCLVIFKRFCFYYDRQINISEEIKTIDTAQLDSQSVDTQDNKRLCFKILPPKCYDTYCYKHRYDSVETNVYKAWTKLTTNRLLKCPRDKEQEFTAQTNYISYQCSQCGKSLKVLRFAQVVKCPYCETEYTRTAIED